MLYGGSNWFEMKHSLPISVGIKVLNVQMDFEFLYRALHSLLKCKGNRTKPSLLMWTDCLPTELYTHGVEKLLGCQLRGMAGGLSNP